MAIAIAIAAILILIYIWSSCLLFYHEKAMPLSSDESKRFDEDCRSITIKNGSRKAVLMIHGFPTTPSMYIYASRRASDAGYDVYAPLIPTFGADWHEFIKTNFSSWYGWIDEYYKTLESEYDEVYVIGTSMGGAMALKLAENHMPKATVTIGAPVVYNSLFRDRIVTSPITYVGRIIAIFVKAVKPGIVTGRSDTNDGNEEWKGYDGEYPRQGISLIWNLKSIRRDLGRISTPLLSIHDKGDETVPFGNLRIIEKEAHATVLATEMEAECKHSHHALLMYRSIQGCLMDTILDFFRQQRQ